jgi:DNA-binding MarR family transcriptional regulator
VSAVDVAAVFAAVRTTIAPLSLASRMCVLSTLLRESAYMLLGDADVHELPKAVEGASSFQDLTHRQYVVLRCIREFTEKNGMPPTLREIGNAVGIGSTNGVADHLKALERKGYLTRAAGSKSRGVRLLARSA